MKRWLIQLEGPVEAFAILEEWFQGPDLDLVRVDDAFYLASSDFRGMTADEVDQHACRLIEAANGAIRVENPSYPPIGIGGVSVYEDDVTGRRDVVVRPRPAVLTLKAFPPTVLVNGEPVRGPDLPRLVRRVRLALADDVVARVLRIMETPTLDFIDMYKVIELIADSVGGEKQLFTAPRNWTDQAEYKRFKQTANSHGGRHAPGKFTPPKKPMTRLTARCYVAGVVDSWLRDEYGA